MTYIESVVSSLFGLSWHASFIPAGSIQSLLQSADTAVLLTNSLAGSTCGLAGQLGPGTGVPVAWAAKACAGPNLSFPHEISHLFGCRHNRCLSAFGRGQFNSSLGLRIRCTLGMIADNLLENWTEC